VVVEDVEVEDVELPGSAVVLVGMGQRQSGGAVVLVEDVEDVGVGSGVSEQLFVSKVQTFSSGLQTHLQLPLQPGSCVVVVGPEDGFSVVATDPSGGMQSQRPLWSRTMPMYVSSGGCRGGTGAG